MTSTDYIKDALSKIAKKFPDIQIKYGFDSLIKSHIVELTPLSEYYNNKELDKEWIPISLEFTKIYPLEEIAFISTDSTLRLNTFIAEYNLPEFRAEIELLNNVFFAPLNEQMLNYNFVSNGSMAILIAGPISDYNPSPFVTIAIKTNSEDDSIPLAA